MQSNCSFCQDSSIMVLSLLGIEGLSATGFVQHPMLASSLRKKHELSELLGS